MILTKKNLLKKMDSKKLSDELERIKEAPMNACLFKFDKAEYLEKKDLIETLIKKSNIMCVVKLTTEEVIIKKII